jgi:hypothetical protein
MTPEVQKLTHTVNNIERAFNQLLQQFKAVKRDHTLAIVRLREEVARLGRPGPVVSDSVVEPPAEDRGAPVEGPVEQTSVRPAVKSNRPERTAYKKGPRTSLGGAK